MRQPEIEEAIRVFLFRKDSSEIYKFGCRGGSSQMPDPRRASMVDAGE
jgi:hypothetical protein